jgi:hypothetical protein
MKHRIPWAAACGAMTALVTTALLSLTAQAASRDRHLPPRLNAKKDTGATASLPPNQASPTVARSPASFTRETPLREALDILRNSTTPRLGIIVLWKPLNSAGIYENTPIGIDGVGRLRVGQVLELLTLSLSAGASAKIGYVIDKGIVTISTTDALPTPKPVVRVYDIRDLVALPAQYSPVTTGFGMGYSGLIMPSSGYTGPPSGVSPNPATPPRTTASNPRNYRSR